MSSMFAVLLVSRGVVLMLVLSSVSLLACVLLRVM